MCWWPLLPDMGPVVESDERNSSPSGGHSIGLSGLFERILSQQV
jgi:hypothetical protein